MKSSKRPAETWTKQQLINTGGIAVKNDLIHAVERAQRAGEDHIVVIIKI
jgi:hypothetical protein